MTIELQQCARCGSFQYPRRDVCGQCLSDALQDAPAADTGRLLAQALVRRTLDPAFASDLPVAIGKVMLDCGVHLVCFVEGEIASHSDVQVRPERNARGEQVWRAIKA